jgi:hypothetical protein
MDAIQKLKVLEEIRILEDSIVNRKRLITAPNKTDSFKLHHKHMIEHEMKLIIILKEKLSKMEK